MRVKENQRFEMCASEIESPYNWYQDPFTTDYEAHAKPSIALPPVTLSAIGNIQTMRNNASQSGELDEINNGKSESYQAHPVVDTGSKISGQLRIMS